MSLKIKVEDRVSTYPGRVTLTPVAGAENTYDMVRADVPINEGTPINATLFASKADILNTDATIYVATTGSDTNGTGGSDSPLRTIQAAIDAIPKNLGGHVVKIEVAAGTYDERISFKGFTGGVIEIGKINTTVTVRGIEVDSSSLIKLLIPRIVYDSAFPGAFIDIKNGSNVFLGSGVTITGGGGSNGISVMKNSSMSMTNGLTLTVNGVGGAVINAIECSSVSLNNVTGSENLFGLSAGYGSIIAYRSSSVTSYLGDEASDGGRILTGGGTSTLATASLE